MDDWEIMQKCRIKWARERAAENLPPLNEHMGAAYHRGFMDALNVALEKVISDECLGDRS